MPLEEQPLYNTRKGLDVSHRTPFPPNKKYYKPQWVGGGLLRILDAVWVGSWWVPGGFRGLCVGSSRSPIQVCAGFVVGLRWAPCGSSRSPMQCKVGSRWALGGFRCCAMWFGVLGSAPRWGGLQVAAIPTKTKAVRATTSNGEPGAQEIACLGRPKACRAHSNFSNPGNPGNPSRKARCHLLPVHWAKTTCSTRSLSHTAIVSTLETNVWETFASL